jgi:hypothetical protein
LFLFAVISEAQYFIDRVTYLLRTGGTEKEIYDISDSSESRLGCFTMAQIVEEVEDTAFMAYEEALKCLAVERWTNAHRDDRLFEPLLSILPDVWLNEILPSTDLRIVRQLSKAFKAAVDTYCQPRRNRRSSSSSGNHETDEMPLQAFPQDIFIEQLIRQRTGLRSWSKAIGYICKDFARLLRRACWIPNSLIPLRLFDYFKTKILAPYDLEEIRITYWSHIVPPVGRFHLLLTLIPALASAIINGYFSIAHEITAKTFLCTFQNNVKLNDRLLRSMEFEDTRGSAITTKSLKVAARLLVACGSSTHFQRDSITICYLLLASIVFESMTRTGLEIECGIAAPTDVWNSESVYWPPHGESEEQRNEYTRRIKIMQRIIDKHIIRNG